MSLQNSLIILLAMYAGFPHISAMHAFTYFNEVFVLLIILCILYK